MTYMLFLLSHQFNQKRSIIHILMFAVEISSCSQSVVLPMSDLYLELTPTNRLLFFFLISS